MKPQDFYCDGDGFASFIANSLSSARETVILSAYVTDKAANLVADNFMKTGSVTIVGRFLVSDFLSGASSFSSVELLLEKGIRVGMVTSLHSKLYYFGGEHAYVGSANLTSAGLSLGYSGNIETTARINYGDSVSSFIDKVLNIATWINKEKLSKMRSFIEGVNVLGIDNCRTWPEEIYTVDQSIFISDLPHCSPDGDLSSYPDSSMPFYKIHEFLQAGNFNAAKQEFLHSKAFRWLVRVVGEREVRFGEVSALLHEEIADDPAPGRREVKEYQSSLYEYVKLFGYEQLELFVPGRKSQVIRKLIRN